MQNSSQSTPLVGLIPAAGKGLRLGLPYPKELYPIIRNNRYKPVAQHVVESLVEAGVEHVVFVVNESKHQLMGYFQSGRSFGCHISYVVQEPVEQRTGGSSGLAEALDSAWHLIRGSNVLFGMADTIMTPSNCLKGLSAKRHDQADAVLAAFEAEFPEKVGMLDLDSAGADADDANSKQSLRLNRIVDKPAQTDLRWMWGAILWRPRFTEYLHAEVSRALESGNALDFAGIMNAAIAQGMDFRAECLPGAGYRDVGTYEEIEALERSYRRDETSAEDSKAATCGPDPS